MAFRRGNAALEEQGRPALPAMVPTVCAHEDTILEFPGERQAEAEAE